MSSVVNRGFARLELLEQMASNDYEHLVLGLFKRPHCEIVMCPGQVFKRFFSSWTAFPVLTLFRL